MGKAMFYHLTQRPMEATLTMLLGKARQAGWRVVVRGCAPERMAWLDEKLWLGPEDGFLPHGLEGGPHDALQPVLLSATSTCPDGVHCLMTIDGADVAANEVSDLDRVCVLFDGNDPEALQTARGQWKALKDAGAKAEYWSEESGTWEKKAET